MEEKEFKYITTKDAIPNCTYDEIPLHINTFQPIFSANATQQFEISGNIYNSELLASCIDSNLGQSFDLFFKHTIYVQARYHKKKRINKKWLKRYGYKNIDIDCRTICTSTSMTPIENGVYFVEFTCDGIEYLLPNWIKNNKKLAVRYCGVEYA